MLNDEDSIIFRSGIYRILAAAFSAPKEDLGGLYDALREAHATLQSPKPPLEVTRASEDPKLSSLAKEHLRLFVGPGHIPCPPYEAVHRKDRPDFEKGLVMGPSTAEVRRAYLAAGLDISKTYTDLPDHIAVEMEFMHFLCAEELKFIEQRDLAESAIRRKMQQEFLRLHLKPWVEAFADCVLNSTGSSFYKEAASLLKVFVGRESESLLESEPE